jgi:hypothetical protein
MSNDERISLKEYMLSLVNDLRGDIQLLDNKFEHVSGRLRDVEDAVKGLTGDTSIIRKVKLKLSDSIAWVIILGLIFGLTYWRSINFKSIVPTTPTPAEVENSKVPLTKGVHHEIAP